VIQGGVPSVPLGREFFARDAETVARDLLGCLLVRRRGGREIRARIVETEAYVGGHDLACHASKGRTPRTEVMFGEAGFAYVYFVYGMHHLLNIVTGPVGDPQAVLLRGLDAWPDPGRDRSMAGPAKLCKHLDIDTPRHNRADLCARGEISFLAGPPPHGPSIHAGPRIGVGYAREWASAPLRFWIGGSPGVSRG
jgi:DNA-3-methyladenine glycosylase